MVSTREPYELSPSSERRYSLQRFIPHAQKESKASSFKFPAVPHNPLQAFDSILHKELVDHVYQAPAPRPKPQARPRDLPAHRRDPSIIVSIRHYHIMLKSLEEAPCETSRNSSWVYEQPKLKKTGCCLICRRSFIYTDAKPLCSMCAAIKSAYEYHETLRPSSSCTLNYIPRSTPRQSWQTTNSYRPSTISWSESPSSLYRTSTSSTYQLPSVCILISRSRIRVLPGLSYSYILARLSSSPSGPLDIVPLFREHKPNTTPPSDGADGGRPISDSLGPKRNSKIAKSNRTSMSGTTSSSANSMTSSAARKRTKKRNTSTRFGCPFAKRNPCRYERVIGSCTMPRGMEMKYIVEHLDRTHSGKYACPYCHEKWPANSTETWMQQLHAHTVTNPCLDAADMLCEPEALNEAQQAALDLYKSERHTEPEPTRWVNLFMALFPDEFPIPSPYYDFFTPTHLIRPRVSGAGVNGSPGGGSTTSGTVSMRDSISSASLSQLPSSDSRSTLMTATGSESNATEQTASEENGHAPQAMSPMLLATTAIDELEPGFEPLEFDDKLPVVGQTVPHAALPQNMGYLGSTMGLEYDSAETMVPANENAMLPMTFGQIWQTNVGDLNLDLGLMGERFVDRPGADQDSVQYLEMIRSQMYHPQ